MRGFGGIGWQELVLVGGCFLTIPFIAGLVMLIVGLSIQKRGLWIAGLITLLVPLALILLAGALIMLASFA